MSERNDNNSKPSSQDLTHSTEVTDDMEFPDISTEPTPDTTWKILRLSMPLLLINSSITLMQSVDAWMVAKLGSDELAAVLPGSLMSFLPMAFMMGVLAGVSTYVSQSLGRNKKEDCGNYAWQGILLSIAFSLVSAILLWIVADEIFMLFPHSENVRALETEYFRISLISFLPVLAGVSLSNFYTGIHRPAILALVAIWATVLNIFFNYILIFGHCGFPAMGLAGAAWGTVIASTMQTIALLIHFLLGERRDLYGSHRWKVDRDAIRGILKVGLPAGFQLGFDILSWGVSLMWLVSLFGTAHMAATTIIVRLIHFSFMPPVAIGQILTAAVGRAIGEGRPELARLQTFYILRANMIYMGSVAILFAAFPEWLFGLFTTDPEIIAIGKSIMIFIAIFQVFDAMGITYIHSLRGAGDTQVPAILTISLCVSILICGGYSTVYFFPALGSAGPWAAGALYIILLGSLMGLRWHFGPWSSMNLFSPTSAEISKTKAASQD